MSILHVLSISYGTVRLLSPSLSSKKARPGKKSRVPKPSCPGESREPASQPASEPASHSAMQPAAPWLTGRPAGQHVRQTASQDPEQPGPDHGPRVDPKFVRCRAPGPLLQTAFAAIALQKPKNEQTPEKKAWSSSHPPALNCSETFGSCNFATPPQIHISRGSQRAASHNNINKGLGPAGFCSRIFVSKTPETTFHRIVPYICIIYIYMYILYIHIDQVSIRRSAKIHKTRTVCQRYIAFGMVRYSAEYSHGVLA